jgi:hypothetical protein
MDIGYLFMQFLICSKEQYCLSKAVLGDSHFLVRTGWLQFLHDVMRI